MVYSSVTKLRRLLLIEWHSHNPMELTADQALQQGVAAHKEGKLQEAERIYRAILQTQPGHPDANHNLGVLAVAVGKPLEAIPLLKLALEANPQIEQFWLSYIDALLRVEHIDEAKRVLVEGKESGVSSDKLDTLLQRLQGGVRNDTQKTAKGQTLSEKRKAQGDTSSEPSQDQLNHFLGHYQAGRWEEAEALATSLTQQFPKHPFGWKALGIVLKQMGRLDESLAPMQSAVTLSPQAAEAHNNLGNILRELGRLDESEASLRQAIALKPDFAEAHYNLGNTLRELGRLDEAEASYREAIALTTGFSVAHQNLAITLRELGKIEQAIQSERYAKFLNSPNVETNESEKFSDNLLFRQPSPIEHSTLYRAGMGTENVGGFLRAMAQMLRPKNILEIGAGYTTPFLLEALINNERVYDDGNLEPSYFRDYVYDSKLVVIDNMSLGELGKKPGMNQIISSKYIEFVEGSFEGKAHTLGEKYGDFDFVWFDCGGSAEYKHFMDEYWDICSDYIFFHFTYSSGSPNELRDIIVNSMTGNPTIFDIVEPHKRRQGSITMIQKN